MFVAWYGGGDQQVSRVNTLGMGIHNLELELSVNPGIDSRVKREY